jgi:hypothetical protein
MLESSKKYDANSVLGVMAAIGSVQLPIEKKV